MANDLDGDALPKKSGIHVVSDLDDLAGDLVASRKSVRLSLVHVHLEIRSANADRPDANDHVAPACLGSGDVPYLHSAVAIE